MDGSAGVHGRVDDVSGHSDYTQVGFFVKSGVGCLKADTLALLQLEGR